MSEVYGGKHLFTHRGKTYEVSLVTMGLSRDFENRRYHAAREALRELKEDYPTDEYVKRIDALRERYDTGAFGLAHVENLKAVANPKDAVLLLSLLFGVDEITALEIISEHPAEIPSLLKTILKESFPGIRFKAQEGGEQGEGEGLEKKAV